MGEDGPVIVIAMLLISIYIFRLWCSDYRRQQAEGPFRAALPGAFPSSRAAVLLGIAGAVIILAVETLGEYALDLVEAQSEITVLFGVYTVAAGFLEELIFRGYLVVDGKGRGMLVGSIIVFSLIFALFHTFGGKGLWGFDESQGFLLNFSSKAVFSTSIVLVNALWFYTVRFCRWNPQRSLIPCIAAHSMSNLLVVIIKAAQGKVSGLY
jgi:uncharacterized protein